MFEDREAERFGTFDSWLLSTMLVSRHKPLIAAVGDTTSYSVQQFVSSILVYDGPDSGPSRVQFSTSDRLEAL